MLNIFQIPIASDSSKGECRTLELHLQSSNPKDSVSITQSPRKLSPASSVGRVLDF